MKKAPILIFFFLSCCSLFCQNIIKDNNYYKAHTFYSLEDALKNPNDVYFLYLQGKRYRKFPKEILLFKNLVSLDLSAIQEASEDRYKISENKYINYIREIPLEIITLDSLKYLDLSGTKMSCKKIKDLYWILPNCDIISDCSEINYLIYDHRYRGKLIEPLYK